MVACQCCYATSKHVCYTSRTICRQTAAISEVLLTANSNLTACRMLPLLAHPHADGCSTTLLLSDTWTLLEQCRHCLHYGLYRAHSVWCSTHGHDYSCCRIMGWHHQMFSRTWKQMTESWTDAQLLTDLASHCATLAVVYY